MPFKTCLMYVNKQHRGLLDGLDLQLLGADEGYQHVITTYMYQQQLNMHVILVKL